MAAVYLCLTLSVIAVHRIKAALSKDKELLHLERSRQLSSDKKGQRVSKLFSTGRVPSGSCSDSSIHTKRNEVET